MAQDSPPDPRVQSRQEQEQNPQDEESQPNQPPQVSDGGPSILGRDKSLTAQRSGRLVDSRFYGEIMGVYDTGITPFTKPGNAANAAQAGLESGFGFIGSRRRKRDTLSIEYKGRYRYYAQDSLFNGSAQFLNLDYRRALRRHLSVKLSATAATTTLANGDFAGLSFATTNLFALPNNDPFDNRTDYIESAVDLLWQTTRRLSLDLGGEGFLVRRESLSLAGLNGSSGRAGLAYRLTRRQTIAATYLHTYFDFQRTYGDAALDTAAIGYSVALSRVFDLGIQLGGSRMHTRGLETVPLDPAIAAIVGRSFAVVTSARLIYVPFAEARLIGRFNRSSLILGYTSTASPGNGIYLTSRQTAGTAAFSYTGYRRFTAAWNATYTELSPLVQTIGKYNSVQGGAGFTYKLAKDTYLELRYDYRHYTTGNFFYKKDSSRVSLGLAFSPGEKPLAIW